MQADDGTPEVWVIDRGKRRHVIDPDSLAAWRLSVTKTPAAMVYANPKGADWPATPDLVQGTAANVYMLDVDTEHQHSGNGGGGSNEGSGGSSGAGTHHQPSGSGGGGGANVGGGDGDVSADSGCSSSGRGGGSSGVWFAALGFALAAAKARRRKG